MHVTWKEIAVDPRVMGYWECFVHFHGNCGFDKGMLLSEFPRKSWRRQVAESARKLTEAGVNTEMRTAKLISLLQTMRDRGKLYRSGRNAGDSTSWTEKAKSQENPPFNAIVSGDEGAEGPKIVRISDDGKDGLVVLTLQEHPLLDSEMTTRCARKAKTLIHEAAGPLLRGAKEIRIVDKYFSPRRENKLNVLVALIKFLHAENCPAKRIQILTELGCGSNQHERTDTASDYLRKIKRELPSGYSVEVLFIEKLPGGETNHPRFLLTDAGGLQYDHGFEEGDGTTTITILGRQIWEQYWNQYSPDSSIYGRDPNHSATLIIP